MARVKTTPQTIITCAAYTFDGVYEGATDLGAIAQASTESQLGSALIGRLRFTPSAGNHTYLVKAPRSGFSGAPNGKIWAGTAEPGWHVPAYIRFTKV